MTSPYICYVAMKSIDGTTSATIGTQTTHAHGLGIAPRFTVILMRSNGIAYQSAVADVTNIYVKGSAASLAFTAVMFA